MARLVGIISNRPDLCSRVIELEGAHLSVQRKNDKAPGWGVGFYQAGEILLKRRPIDDRAEITLSDMTQGIRTDTLVAHVRDATIGTRSTENTHPFRYRQWLFAHTGTIEGFGALRGRLRDSLPQFLQRDVRGDTDSELLFHLFLSFLHDAGKLDRPVVDDVSAKSALRSTIALVDRLCAEEGAGPSEMNIVISSPDYLLALHAGAKMAFRSYHGQSDLERLFGDGGLGRMRIPDFAQSRLTLVASDFNRGAVPPGWTEVTGRAIVTFTRLDEPTPEAL